jgi:hypothetical protein
MVGLSKNFKGWMHEDHGHWPDSVGCMLTHDDEEKLTFPRVGASDCRRTNSEEGHFLAHKGCNDFVHTLGILPSSVTGYLIGFCESLTCKGTTLRE